MEKLSNKAAANPLPATNAIAGSTERDAQSPPALSETHSLESAVAHPPETFDLPPSELAPWLAILTPEILKAFEAEHSDDSVKDWFAIAERLDFEDAVFDDDAHPPHRALAIALHESGRLHALSREYPLEVMAVAGKAFSTLESEGHAAAAYVLEDFLAPELVAAIEWLYKNRTAEFLEAVGFSHQIN